MTFNDKRITAILPVRKGSQRIPNKNFRKFGDSCLFEMKLKTLLELNFIDEVLVSSDSKEAIELAEKLGASVHLRDNYYASSVCTNSEFFLNFSEMTNSNFIMYSPCTSPLISKETYYSFINSFHRLGEEHDSVASVRLIKQHLWTKDGPLNYEISKSPNSQDLPDIYALTYGINIISRENLIQYKNIIGKKPKFYILDDIEAIDIDNLDEFQTAEFFYKQKYTKIR